MSDTRTGGCLCGALRYEFSGEPLFAGNCYCTDCQKYSGGGHLAAIGVLEDNFKLTGETTTFTKTADSGGPIVRHFCPTCGSHIGSSAAGGVRIIYAGTLDDPETYVPVHNIYTARAQKWDQPDPSIPGFPEGPPAG